MSTGGLVGAGIGAVIGYALFYVNPALGTLAILYGAGIGFGIGTVLDPATSDAPAAGAPDQQGLQIMTNAIGTPIFDILGTIKCTGNLIWYGLERNEAVYGQSSGGGKGGSSEPPPQVTGYKYYMSWAMGLCLGEVDTIYTVYKNDTVVWEGTLDRPASGGEETITLTDMGSATIYFGTDDQVANTKLGAGLDDSTLNTPYRGLCWVYFDDCYIGEYNRCPTMKFVMRKSPACSFDSEKIYNDIQAYDYNPMHAIWYILHNLTGFSTDWLHDADFFAAATTLSCEFRGISILFDRSQAAMSYIEAVNSHVDGILRYGIDGAFHPKLIRDDYTVGDLSTVNETVLLDDPSFNRKSWIDTINEVKVQYTELINVTRYMAYLLWGTGGGYYGQLDRGLDGLDGNTYVLTLISSKRWKSIFMCFQDTTMAIKDDGTLWVTGNNNYGQLGLGDNDNRNEFTQVGTDAWLQVSCGNGSTRAIRNDELITGVSDRGSLWVTGYNYAGQLGLGDSTNRNVLTQVGTGFGWKQVSSGYQHMHAIDNTNALWGAGYNGAGQLGLSSPSYSTVLIRITDIFASELFDTFGDFSFILDSNNFIWSTGINTYGQLGLGDNTTRKVFTQVGTDHWKMVSGGQYHALAIKDDGTLWATGRNGSGQLGLGDNDNRNEFTQVGTDTWKFVECGANHTLAIKDDGTLWGTGENGSYQLGLGYPDNNDRNEFVQIGTGTWTQIAASQFTSLAL